MTISRMLLQSFSNPGPEPIAKQGLKTVVGRSELNRFLLLQR